MIETTAAELVFTHVAVLIWGIALGSGVWK